MAAPGSVTEWLTRVRLEEYLDLFTQHGITTLDACAALDEESKLVCKQAREAGWRVGEIQIR